MQLQDKLRSALTTEDLNELRSRNEQRAAEARERMGDRWSCHPTNRVQKNPNPPVLSRMMY